MQSRVAGDEVSPSSRTVNQAAHERQASVGVANVELGIPKLMSEAARDIWFQAAHVPAMIYQVGWPDADQPLEYTFFKRRYLISDIVEFFPVPGTRNVRETSKEAVCIIAACQLSNPCFILLLLLRILKSSEMREADILLRFFSRLRIAGQWRANHVIRHV